MDFLLCRRQRRRSRSPAPFTAPTFRTAKSLRPDHGMAGKQTNYRFSQVGLQLVILFLPALFAPVFSLG